MARRRIATTLLTLALLTVGATVALLARSPRPAEAHATFAILTGPGPLLTPQVRAWTRTGTLTSPTYNAYSSTFPGGVFVASGDVTGDGHPDAITGPGAGSPQRVRIVDGISGITVRTFFAYSTGFKGGVRVAAGDVNGDGFADVITGAGPGSGPFVKVFDGDTGNLLRSFPAYSTGFKGGVFVAAGDVSGDGLADIITGAGAGSGPFVKVFDGDTGARIMSFPAFSTGFKGGVTVGSGDVNGDFFSDIITGAGPGSGPFVKVFDGDTGGRFITFLPFSSTFHGGVFVSAADMNQDPFADIVVGAGPGSGPWVKAYDGDTGGRLLQYLAYPSSFREGVHVAGNLGTHPPDITVTGGPADEASTNDTTPTYNGTATDSDGTVTDVIVAVDEGDFTDVGVVCTGCGTNSATWTFTPAAPLPAGEHTLFFVAVDNSGLFDIDLRTVTIDTTSPTVTINQAAGQNDPTNASPITFTAVFSEAVTGFTNADVTIGGTAGGTKSASVTGGPTTYTVQISGMTTPGTVTASIPASAATDAAGNNSAASTSTDNTVTWDATDPTVTVEQGASQTDPTNTSPITFTATFSENVTGFDNTDVTIGGTAGGTKSASVSGGPAVYTIQISGMTTGGTVIASIPADAAVDAVGNGNAASTSTDNTVTWDPTAPTFDSITANGTTTVTAIFSEPLDCATVAAPDFLATIQGSPVAVNSVTCTGASDATIDVTLASAPAEGNTVAVSLVGEVKDPAGNAAATPTTRSTTADATDPTVTINQGASQEDPTDTSPITFTAVFSEAVTGFTNADVTVGGTAGGTKTVGVTGGPTTYTIQVSGMTTAGTVIASIPADGAFDAVGNGNAASTSTDNTVTWDPVAPTVTINQGASQADPTTTSPITFTAVFSEAVTGFTNADVTVSGTAGGTKAVAVTGGPTTYTVEVSGMTTDGTVIASIPAAAASDLAGNTSAASTSTDNTVTWDGAPTVTINQAAAQEDPTDTSPITFTVTFSEPVTGFTNGDVTIGGTAGGTKSVAVTGGPTTYTVEVSGMTTDGTVTASIGSGVAQDLTGNNNAASTSTDNTVTWDTTSPSFGWISATAGNATVTATFTALNDPLLCGSVSASDFLASVGGSPVVVNSVTCSGSADGTIGVTLASAPTAGQTVILDLNGTLTDRAGNTVADANKSTVASSPTVAVTAGPADGSSTSDTTPTFSGTATDPDLVNAVQVSLDGGLTFSTVDVTCGLCGVPVVGTDVTWSYTPGSALSAGTYTFVFRSVDDDGGFSAPEVRTVTIT